MSGRRVSPVAAPVPLFSKVIWVFGAVDRSELPGPFLVSVLGDLGIVEATARSGLSRAVVRGALRRSRSGRLSLYALAPTLRASLDRSHGRKLAPERADWDGRMHTILHRIPERSRQYRDALRYAARSVGYAPLTGGLLVNPWDRWQDIADLASRSPQGSRVSRGTLTLDGPEIPEIVSEAWSLPATAALVRRQVQQIERRLARATPPVPGPRSLRAFVELTLRGYAAVALDPDLPAELLPHDWPMPELVDALGRAAEYFGDSAVTHLEARLG